MDNTSVSGLFTLAEIAAAVNLAYMNLSSTRFADRIKSHIRTNVINSRQYETVNTNIGWAEVQNKPQYWEFYEKGSLGEIGFPEAKKKLEDENFSADKNFAKFSNWFLESVIANKTSDHVISAACFSLSIWAIMYLSAWFAFSVINGFILNLVFAILVMFAFGAVIFATKIGKVAKVIFFVIASIFLYCIYHAHNNLGPFEWTIGQIDFNIPEIFYTLISMCLLLPTAMVVAAHQVLPDIEKQYSQLGATVFEPLKKKSRAA